jgi:hypothetical protein
MRALTKRQKSLIRDFVGKNKEDLFGFDHMDKMPDELWERLRSINDTEILYQNCNNYINDIIHRSEEPW